MIRESNHHYLTSVFNLSNFLELEKQCLSIHQLRKEIKMMHPSFIPCYYNFYEIGIIYKHLFTLITLICSFLHVFFYKMMKALLGKHSEAINFYIKSKMQILPKCYFMLLSPYMSLADFTRQFYRVNISIIHIFQSTRLSVLKTNLLF